MDVRETDMCRSQTKRSHPSVRKGRETSRSWRIERGATQVASGEGKTLWVLGGLYEFKATGEDTRGMFALWETTTPPGNPGPPSHIHHNEDEVFYLLEGELELMVEGRASVVGAGTFVNIPRGTLHTFRNAGTTPARFLGMVTPGGFEGFFEEVG
jgi:mannose-6-phosphate isomerase-like protein (cupin superfamily)